MGYKEDQRAIATGVTDGSKDLVRDLVENLRTIPDRNTVLEEVALEFEKMLGDTPASFAAYVRGMKR
jgi:hypothetical protein